MNSLRFAGSFLLILVASLFFSRQGFSQHIDLKKVYGALQDVEVAEEFPVGDFNNSEGLGGFSFLMEAGHNTWSSTAITTEETGEFTFENGLVTLKKANGQHLQFDLVRFKNAHILIAPEQREDFSAALEKYNDDKVHDAFRGIHIYRFFSLRGFYIKVNS